MKKAIIMVILLALISAGGITVFFRQLTPSKEKTNDEILESIITSIPAYAHEGRPIIKIASASRHEDKWYVVTIQSLREVETFVPVKLVLLESNDGLPIIYGPDTYFPDNQLLKYNLPETAILELQKS